MMSGTVRRAAWILLALVLVTTTAAVLVHLGRGRGAVEPPGSPPVSGPAARSAPSIAISPAPQAEPGATAGRATSAGLNRAREVLATIEERGGAPPPGYVGGREFQNRERRLPPGRYREYDVHPRVPGRDRGPERLVIDRATGRAYYTADHYRTFVPLQ